MDRKDKRMNQSPLHNESGLTFVEMVYGSFFFFVIIGLLAGLFHMFFVVEHREDSVEGYRELVEQAREDERKYIVEDVLVEEERVVLYTREKKSIVYETGEGKIYRWDGQGNRSTVMERDGKFKVIEGYWVVKGEKEEYKILNIEEWLN